jgi:hypothetical protein
MALVNTNKSFKYDVAFSFLKEDESLAYQINDLIQDRVSTFIYSEHQKDIVGKNGYDEYTKVFLNESRIVVILYREAWGTTPFTRIEENALKQRSTEESLDFTVIISLDKNKPQWVSKFQIWYDFDRYGIKPAAAIIEKKVSEYGGLVHEETIEDQIARHKREIQRQKDWDSYFLSAQALTDASHEIEKLLEIAEQNMATIEDRDVGIYFGKNKKQGEYYTSFAQHFGLTFRWRQQYVDSLVGSYLEVFFADEDYYDRNPNRNGERIKHEDYIFYLNEANNKGWVRKKDKSDFKTTEQLISIWQKDFLERARLERVKLNAERSRY